MPKAKKVDYVREGIKKTRVRGGELYRQAAHKYDYLFGSNGKLDKREDKKIRHELGDQIQKYAKMAIHPEIFDKAKVVNYAKKAIYDPDKLIARKIQKRKLQDLQPTAEGKRRISIDAAEYEENKKVQDKRKASAKVIQRKFREKLEKKKSLKK